MKKVNPLFGNAEANTFKSSPPAELGVDECDGDEEEQVCKTAAPHELHYLFLSLSPHMLSSLKNAPLPRRPRPW
jgi:hypothetical protein